MIIYDNMRQSDVPIGTAIIGSIFRQSHFSRCHEIKAHWDKRSLAVLMSWYRPNRPNQRCCWSISVLLPVPLLWKAVVSPQPTCEKQPIYRTTLHLDRATTCAPESAKMLVILTTTPAIAVLLLIRVALCENGLPGSTHWWIIISMSYQSHIAKNTVAR